MTLGADPRRLLKPPPKKDHMANTNAVDRDNRPSYGGSSFEVPGYDTEKIEPDAYEGEYEAKFNSIKWKMTSSAPPRPMILLEWKLETTANESEEAQKSLHAKVTDFIVLANDKSGNTGKIKLRTLKELLDLEIDLSVMNPETVNKLGALLKGLGRLVPLWVVNRKDGDGNVRTNVNYTAPGGGGSAMAPMGGEDEEEEEVTPKAKKKTAGRR